MVSLSSCVIGDAHFRAPASNSRSYPLLTFKCVSLCDHRKKEICYLRRGRSQYLEIHSVLAFFPVEMWIKVHAEDKKKTQQWQTKQMLYPLRVLLASDELKHGLISRRADVNVSLRWEDPAGLLLWFAFGQILMEIIYHLIQKYPILLSHLQGIWQPEASGSSHFPVTNISDWHFAIKRLSPCETKHGIWLCRITSRQNWDVN